MTADSDDLEPLEDAIFYHGTTEKSWSVDGAGCDGGLYITTHLEDALNYADEAAVSEIVDLEESGEPADGVRAILVTLGSADVARLLADGCSIEPDWGWINGLGEAAGAPGWQESLLAVGTIHLGGFSQRHKSGLSTRLAFEASAPPSDCAIPGNAVASGAKEGNDMDKQYKREFPEFDREIVVPEGFEDISWHNDTCPSFHHLAYGMTLYVDYENPELREFPEAPAFNLVRSDELGGPADEADAGEVDLAQSDDFDEMLARIAELAKDTERQRRLEIQRQAEAAGFSHESAFADGVISLFWKGLIDGREARIGGHDLKTAFPAPGEKWAMTVEFPDSGHHVGIEVDDFAAAIEAASIAVAQLESSAQGPKH